ncbi:21750_t:CDS:2 [Gigaspora margarita]|uniref:21750_t:CDS:1 n=1 Tax=Gigaspora margarita TaxID=4874 RepID=A0ABM8W2N5_GIGMA|nr:21750_t:CDS:2 [Gigaspora margarita]
MNVPVGIIETGRSLRLDLEDQAETSPNLLEVHQSQVADLRCSFIGKAIQCLPITIPQHLPPRHNIFHSQSLKR